jgi:hypothetical protein
MEALSAAAKFPSGEAVSPGRLVMNEDCKCLGGQKSRQRQRNNFQDCCGAALRTDRA